jgi:pimeloyl-ACP methyl ester carboxylesterase
MRLSRRQILAGSASLTAFGKYTTQSTWAASEEVRTWRDYAQGGWGQIHLWMAEPKAGPGTKTPLVCMHQSPTSGAYYKEFQAVMATDRLVISPDTPGYGGSTAPPSIPDMAAYGQAIIEALENLGYGAGGKGPVDVLGFHTGNFVTIEMAVKRPDLVRKLVMPGIPYFTESEREAKRQQYAQPRHFFTDPEYMAKSYRANVYTRDFGVPKERHLEMFVERLRSGTKSHYAFDAVFRYAPEAALQALTQPVLLPILNETLAEPTRTAGTLIKHKTFVDLMDLDGWAWFTTPERIAAVVRPFLDEA